MFRDLKADPSGLRPGAFHATWMDQAGAHTSPPPSSAGGRRSA